MGYTHNWLRPKEIPAATFRAIRENFERLILPLSDAGVELAGASGKGPPEITDDALRFNGPDRCGHPENGLILIPYPSEMAEGIGPNSTAIDPSPDGIVTLLKHRCCNGHCSYAAFSFPRALDTGARKPDENGLYSDFVRTGFRPYDIAVTAVLLIAKRHLKDQFVIHSNGGEYQWVDARRICQRFLNFGDWFGIVEEDIPYRQPAAYKQRQVLRRTLVEVDPATLTR